MATKYLALLTNIGAAKLAKATALGTKVEITQLAVGDGNGVLPTPNPAQTALVHEQRRAPLNMLTVDPANASQIIAEQVLPEDVGGWWIREIGLFDKDGDMVAIANCAETYKPQLQEGSGRVQVIRVILIVSSTEAVTLKIDPAVVLATRQYVDSQLRAHEQSRNHPDASTTEKGFVQLSSSVTSDSESQAATPKAVKITMDNGSARLAKDRNLSDLPNTALARQNLELGDSSTRNVGTTAGTVASGDDARITGAMQKNQNGADIPDVAKFLQNLGLVETINRAAGALQKDQNLNDVPDKAKARKALQLGSAATLDATTAVNDCTLGRVLKVGDFGLGAQTFGVIPDSHPVSERAAYGVNFSRVFKSTDAPRMDTYFNLLMMPETLNGTFAALAMSENTTPCYRAYGVGSNKSIQWAKIYDELNKPTATDVGALPTTGGNLLGQLAFLFPATRAEANCLIANGDANGILACQYGYYQDRFDLHFYDEKGAWESNPLSIGRNGNTTVRGNLSGLAVYEGNTRVYSPNNPPPAPNLSGYATQQWVLQNFVQNIDLTAPAEVGFWDGRGYPRGTDGAAMYNFNMVGGSSNVGNFIVRYTRKQVNNTWYVIN
ncbi:phage tail protein [Citrobacter freundii]|uniref:phage tail protein n=1 Tax=Citrobacter freundii TaxID=546 RepID=UPI00374EDF9D